MKKLNIIIMLVGVLLVSVFVTADTLITDTYISVNNVTGLESNNIGDLTPATAGYTYVITKDFNYTNINGHGFTDERQLHLSSGYNYASFDSVTTEYGNINHDHKNAFQARDTFSGTGTITNFRGYRSYPLVTNGFVTNLYHFQAAHRDDTGGVVTNEYGLYIDDIKNSTNQYSIYTAGSDDKNYFGGKIGIGTSPNQYLDIYTGTDNTAVHINSSDANAYMRFYDDTGNILIGLTAGINFEIKNSAASGKFIFNTSNGKLGVNTLTPTAKLDVNGDIKATDYKSSDGTSGMTGSCGAATTLTIKNGLVTSCA